MLVNKSTSASGLCITNPTQCCPATGLTSLPPTLKHRDLGYWDFLLLPWQEKHFGAYEGVLGDLQQLSVVSSSHSNIMQGRFFSEVLLFLEQRTLVGIGWPKPDQNSGQKGYGNSFVSQISTNTIYFFGCGCFCSSAFQILPPTEVGLCFLYQHGT